MQGYLEKKQDIEGVLEKYNFFHDGFIKKICIKSLDNFDADKGRDLLGDFEVEIDFAYCYAENLPYNYIVKVHFKGVHNIYCDFRGIGSIEWDILSVDIENNDNISKDGRFLFKVTLVYWNNEKEVTGEKIYPLFTFDKVRFIEPKKS